MTAKTLAEYFDGEHDAFEMIPPNLRDVYILFRVKGSGKDFRELRIPLWNKVTIGGKDYRYGIFKPPSGAGVVFYVSEQEEVAR